MSSRSAIESLALGEFSLNVGKNPGFGTNRLGERANGSKRFEGGKNGLRDRGIEVIDVVGGERVVVLCISNLRKGRGEVDECRNEKLFHVAWVQTFEVT